MNNFTSQLNPSDLIIWRNNQFAEHLKTDLGFQVVTNEDAFWQYDFSKITRLVILKELGWKRDKQIINGRKVLQDWSLNYHFWQLPISKCSIIKKDYWQKNESLEPMFEGPAIKSRFFYWNHIDGRTPSSPAGYLQVLRQLFMDMYHPRPIINESSIYAIINQFNSCLESGELKRAKSIHYKCMRGRLALLKICLQKSKPSFSDPKLYNELFQKDQCLIDLLDHLLIASSILVHQYSIKQIQEWGRCIQDQYLSSNTLLSQTIMQNQVIKQVN